MTIKRAEKGVGTALVRVPSLKVFGHAPGRIADATRVKVAGEQGTYRVLAVSEDGVDPADGGPARVLGRRLVKIRPDRNDPDLFPTAPRVQKTGGSRKARKLARQRARNWETRR